MNNPIFVIFQQIISSLVFFFYEGEAAERYLCSLQLEDSRFLRKKSWQSTLIEENNLVKNGRNAAILNRSRGKQAENRPPWKRTMPGLKTEQKQAKTAILQKKARNIDRLAFTIYQNTEKLSEALWCFGEKTVITNNLIFRRNPRSNSL